MCCFLIYNEEVERCVHFYRLYFNITKYAFRPVEEQYPQSGVLLLFHLFISMFIVTKIVIFTPLQK